ncbi:MAG: putative undecaprenyl-phosphate N-acetylglucosaminyl 1-phosphate transferase, partial [Planctomycetota bacterium]
MGIFLGLGFLGAFLLAVLVTPLVRRAAPALGLIDLPGDRKVHVIPTPRGGGIAIFLGVLVPALILPA